MRRAPGLPPFLVADPAPRLSGNLHPSRADGCNAAIFGRRKANIESAAAELSKATGKKCIGISGDVRKLDTLEEAVKKTVAEFGRIDFVVAGASRFERLRKCTRSVAADSQAPLATSWLRSPVGLPFSFTAASPAPADIASYTGLSANAFKTVLEIDTLGTYHTFKATIDELCKTKGSLIAISATLHYTATPLQAHVSAAKAGVDALIKVIGVEYGPRGVRANVRPVFAPAAPLGPPCLCLPVRLRKSR